MDDPQPDEFSSLKGYNTDPPEARFTPPGSQSRGKPPQIDGFSLQDTAKPDRSSGIPEAAPDEGHGMEPASSGGYVSTGSLLRAWRLRRAARGFNGQVSTSRHRALEKHHISCYN